MSAEGSFPETFRFFIDVKSLPSFSEMSGDQKIVVFTPITPEFTQDFVSILDQFKVPEDFRQFLLTNECTSVRAFVDTTSDPKLFDKNVIDACGIDLSFGAKLAVRRTFTACMEMTNSGCTSSGGGGVAAGP